MYILLQKFYPAVIDVKALEETAVDPWFGEWHFLSWNNIHTVAIGKSCKLL